MFGEGFSSLADGNYAVAHLFESHYNKNRFLKGSRRKDESFCIMLQSEKYQKRKVEKEEYGLPLKVLAGMGEVQEQASGSVDGFSEEMLVMNPAGETMLDKALFLMRKEKVQIGLKAVLTETNQEWNSLELYEEIKKEHEYMQKNAAERKE